MAQVKGLIAAIKTPCYVVYNYYMIMIVMLIVIMMIITI